MNDYTGIDQASQKLSHSDGSAMRALVVDDEESLADLVAMSLRYEGWDVKTAHSVSEAMSQAKTFSPDIAVLDIMLPDGDGLSLMKSLRGVHTGLPVLFLTAKDSVDDRVAGLTAGGDDYVTKPFSLEEDFVREKVLSRLPIAFS
jgi:two-component system OmpR family response regulator